MDLSEPSLDKYFPYYLTHEQKIELTKNLKKSPNEINYYSSLHKDDLFQGDGWSDFCIYDFSLKDQKSIRGIILSNTCDISPENKREIIPNIIWAPIIKIKNYENLLRSSGVSQQVINGKLASIRAQHMTNVFFLPQGSELEDEYVALLDKAQSFPMNLWLDRENKKKFFTLSTAGFYLFVMKLSIHFCRLHENVTR